MTLAALGAVANTPAADHGVFCGPTDVVFVIDDTGSMGGAIANVGDELASIFGTINDVSGGDFRVGLVTFKDTVEVDADVGTDPATVQTQIDNLVAGGGAGLPEASDEALNTVVNGLAARPGQVGDFGALRAGALKIVILVTDAPPGGFDDTLTLGVDDVNLAQRGTEAASQGIFISAIFVPTGGDYAGQRAMLEDLATTTGGLFIETASDGSGTGAAITGIVDDCGSANHRPECGGAAPSVAMLWPPNHKYVDVTVDGVTDPDANDTLTVTITSIFQDEPVFTGGKGDGSTKPDGKGVGTDTASVRAERSGLGDGRVYVIGFSASDGTESCSGAVEVFVPHDQSVPTAVNSGAVHDSTVG